MRVRAERLAPLVLVALLAAAALYRVIDTEAAVSAMPPAPPPPEPSAAAPTPPRAPGVAVLKIELPPPPPMPRTAPATPAPRRALQPSPPTPQKPAPPARPALRPAPEPAPSPPPSDPAAVQKSGRSLLRVLEHGQGPAIEIAWPDGAGARAALYRRLVACHGMQVALMDTGGRLFAAAGAPGAPWAINMDRYSGFVRQAEGRITAAEQSTAARIAARHRLPSSAAIVRVFPRGVDASLLGGLHGLLGKGYAQAAAIRGRYRLAGGRLLVSDITADGRPVPQPVALSPARGGRCR